MAYYVGLDVSVKETSICIMDDKGGVAARTDVSTDPDLIAHFISKVACELPAIIPLRAHRGMATMAFKHKVLGHA